MMNNDYRRLKTIALATVIALAMTGCTVALDESNETEEVILTSDIEETVIEDTIEVIKEKEIIVKSEKINEETEAFITEVEMPIISGFDDEVFEKRVNDEINEAITTFVETIKTYAIEIKEEGYLTSPYYAGISYSVQLENSNYLSLIINFNEYTGGAHGNYYLESLTYDLVEEKELALSDLFIDGSDYMAQLETGVTKAIEEKRKTSEYGDLLHSWYEGLDEETVNFTLEEDGIGVYFMPYQIGPYAEGGPSFIIPFESFDGILSINEY